MTNLDGSGLQRVSPPDLQVEPAGAWSPDGSQILLETSASEDHSEIWVVNADGSSAHELPITPACGGPSPIRTRSGASIPRGRPTGRRSCSPARTRTGEANISIVNVDGSGLLQVTDGSFDHQPDWGMPPDGIARIGALRPSEPAPPVAGCAHVGLRPSIQPPIQPPDDFARVTLTYEDVRRPQHTARSRLVLERSEPLIRPVPEAFEDFYAREYLGVVGLAYALSGSRWGAEDLAQEAFIAAHRDWDRIGLYDKPGAWVRRVVANLSVSSFRLRGRGEGPRAHRVRP